MRRATICAELRRVGAGSIGEARDLRDAVQLAAQRLGERPLLGRFRADLLPSPVRFWSLTGFQVVLVYKSGSTPPRILRLLNTARDFAPLLATITAELERDEFRSDRILSF